MFFETLFHLYMSLTKELSAGLVLAITASCRQPWDLYLLLRLPRLTLGDALSKASSRCLMIQS